jgi:hypothetical protein
MHSLIHYCQYWLARNRDKLSVQSVPITTKVAIEFEPRSWRGVQYTVYWIQHYVIKFVSHLRQVG